MTVDAKPAARLDLQLKAVADPARRRILALLRRKGCCSLDLVGRASPGMCVCDLEAQVDLSQPTISHHIQVLREAGLITTRKMGRWLYCRRNEAALEALGERLKEL